MSNPLSLLPFAVGAHGGSIDRIPAAQLVAAGLTLLQRCGPLARDLYGKRAAVLLPTGQWIGLDRRMAQRYPGSPWFR